MAVLSQAQIDRLTQIQRHLLAKQDSIWAPIVAYLTPLTAEYDLETAVERVRLARQAAFDAMIEAMTQVSKILTPEQVADFPADLRSSFDIESLKARRPMNGFVPAY